MNDVPMSAMSLSFFLQSNQVHCLVVVVQAIAIATGIAQAIETATAIWIMNNMIYIIYVVGVMK